MYTFGMYYPLDEPLAGIEEIPLIVMWEIDTVLCNYPSRNDPMQPAEEPVALLNDFILDTNESHFFSSWDEYHTMQAYINSHYDEIFAFIQESPELEEAFANTVDPNPY